MRIDDTGLRTVSLIPAALPLTCALENPQAAMTTSKELCSFVQHCTGGGV